MLLFPFKNSPLLFLSPSHWRISFPVEFARVGTKIWTRFCHMEISVHFWVYELFADIISNESSIDAIHNIYSAEWKFDMNHHVIIYSKNSGFLDDIFFHLVIVYSKKTHTGVFGRWVDDNSSRLNFNEFNLNWIKNEQKSSKHRNKLNVTAWIFDWRIIVWKQTK